MNIVHSELVLPACPVDRIEAGHTRMTTKTQQSENTWVNIYQPHPTATTTTPLLGEMIPVS